MKAASTKDLLKYDQSAYPPALFTLTVCHLISGTGQTIPETRLVKRLGGDVMVGRSFHLAYPRPFLGSQTPTENLPTTKLLPNPWRTGLWCGVTAKLALSSGQHQVTLHCCRACESTHRIPLKGESHLHCATSLYQLLQSHPCVWVQVSRERLEVTLAQKTEANRCDFSSSH